MERLQGVGRSGKGRRAKLQMTLQFPLVMIASAINDGQQRKLDHLEEERHILREQLGWPRENGAKGKVACRSRLAAMLDFYHRETT